MTSQFTKGLVTTVPGVPRIAAAKAAAQAAAAGGGAAASATFAPLSRGGGDDAGSPELSPSATIVVVTPRQRGLDALAPSPSSSAIAPLAESLSALFPALDAPPGQEVAWLERRRAEAVPAGQRPRWREQLQQRLASVEESIGAARRDKRKVDSQLKELRDALKQSLAELRVDAV